MGSIQKYGFLATSFLVLTLLADSTAACYCLSRDPPDLQTKYCAADVVVKGKFVNAEIGDPLWYWVRYDFQTTKVFKKPEHLLDVKALFTQLLGTTCGYRHAAPFNDDEYVVTGHLIQHRAIIDLCSAIMPWDKLSREQRRGLMLTYAPQCN